MLDNLLCFIFAVFTLFVIGLVANWLDTCGKDDQLSKDIEAVCYTVTKTPQAYKACMQKKNINEVLKLVEVSKK